MSQSGTPISRRGILLLAALPLACASPSPNLYTLSMLPGREYRGVPKLIELRTIGLARYLERSQIVRSTEPYRLDILPNDWWGEPLDTMLGRVLVQSLSQRLVGGTVFPENGAISGTADATIGVNVQRLDQAMNGSVMLVAQVSVTRRGMVAKTFTIAVEPRSVGVAGLVAAMNEAVGRLADDIAVMVVGG